MNQVTILGKCGSDAELKYTQAGKAVVNISIATNEKYQDKVETCWHRVVIFGKTAEMISPLIKRGCEVFVHGKISNREYTDKNGNKRVSSDIIANWVRVIQKAYPVQNEQHGSHQNDSIIKKDNDMSFDAQSHFMEEDVPF